MEAVVVAVPTCPRIVARPKWKLNSPGIHGVAMKSGFHLVHFSGEVVVTHFSLFTGTNIVGRSSQTHVRLLDWSVSRRHAELFVEEDKVTLRDLGSRNGTFIDERQVQVGALRTGHRVRFGAVNFRLVAEGDSDYDFESELETSDPRYSGNHIPPAPKLPLENLTPAQLRVLELLVKGISEIQVATELGISQHTVHNHVKEIYKAFRVHKRAELISYILPKVSQTLILRSEDNEQTQAPCGGARR